MQIKTAADHSTVQAWHSPRQAVPLTSGFLLVEVPHHYSVVAAAEKE